MLIRVFAIWLALLVLAVANGIARNALITPRIGEPGGHVASTVVLCAVIFAVSWATVLWIGPKGPREALLIGLVWLVLTLAFEFLAGHYLFGHPWSNSSVIPGRSSWPTTTWPEDGSGCSCRRPPCSRRAGRGGRGDETGTGASSARGARILQRGVSPRPSVADPSVP